MPWGAQVPLAWRILCYDKRRTALAVAGIFMAILLVFLELGFFFAVPQGGLLLYDHMKFDLMLVSDQYEYQAEPGAFAANRLDPVRATVEAALVTPLYFAGAKWKDGADGKAPDVFVIGFAATDKLFDNDRINRQIGVLGRPDTLLVDTMTRPLFGSLATGRKVEIDDRLMTIGGQYDLGTGFMGLGVVLVDAANFARLFPRRGEGTVNLAPIQLRPGMDLDASAAALRKVIAPDMRIFTRRELEARETSYWTTRTSVGLIFGSGLAIALVVGIVVVFQTLATQVSRQLPQFATLKAIGYADRSLGMTVVAMALVIVAAGFVPAATAALALYRVIRDQTLLPVAMSGGRLAAVFAAAMAMAAISAWLALGNLRRADPAEVF